MRDNARCTDEQVQSELDKLASWSVQNGKLVRRFRFSSYLDGIRFVDQVALIA